MECLLPYLKRPSSFIFHYQPAAPRDIFAFIEGFYNRTRHLRMDPSGARMKEELPAASFSQAKAQK
jgi:hypothetical protein